LELKQLRYFYQVYKEKSINSASRTLNISQQAISKQILNLEEELGVSILERNIYGVCATEYGDLLAKESEKLLNDHDYIIYLIQQKKNSLSGDVRIGILCWQIGIEHNSNVSIFERFEKDNPKINLTWYNYSPFGCELNVRESKVDFAISVMPDKHELYNCEKLCSFSWYMLMRKDHQLASKKCIYVEDLAGHKLVFPIEEVKLRNKIAQKLYQYEHTVFIETNDMQFDILTQEVWGKNAIMLTLSAQKGLFNPDKFCMIPFKSELLPTLLYIISKKGLQLTPQASYVKEYLIRNWPVNNE